MFGLGTQELLFIILLILLFFGGKKIPELMKGLGKGVRSFKEGMKEVEAVLPAILLKSILLATGAGFVAGYFKKVSLGLLVLIVAFYQIFGTLGEWMMQGDFYLAIQDFRIGIPGMLLQIIGGYLFITHFIRK